MAMTRTDMGATVAGAETPVGAGAGTNGKRLSDRGDHADG